MCVFVFPSRTIMMVCVTFWPKSLPSPSVSLISDEWCLTNPLKCFGELMLPKNIWWNQDLSERATTGNFRKRRKVQRYLFLTEVLDGVVALLVVHFDGLSVGTADAVADCVATYHNVLALRGRPAHYDAVNQRADVEGAGLVRYAGFWRGKSV